MKKLIVLFVSMFYTTVGWSAAVNVSLNTAQNTVNVGDTFTVELLATIPDPVLGWGIDVGFDDTQLELVGGPIVVEPWAQGQSPDGDDLTGLAFPDPVSGANVILALFSFKAIAVGEVTLEPSVTPGDLTEGFALANQPLPGVFADVTFNSLDLIIQDSVIDEKCALIVKNNRCTITGSRASETLVGTNGNDIICGLGGNDTLYGLEGDDILCGGKGNDTLHGGDGNDQIQGQAGRDKLYGENGKDILEGGDGIDILIGGDDDDLLQGNAGMDLLLGKSGSDVLEGGDGNDWIFGGDGNDFLFGEDDNDYLHGMRGSDTCDGGVGRNLLVSCEN
ncbi:hemolysin-type calcium-binding region protein [Candidatus Thiomargarita nelsonii]|uniref:Hemolysin-type calcium-binding region protein n=1 Tax=Candidatus Thiomargarita nelsonii TaxID=1003181 RepID=A0A176S1S6_9GAMM|nr:hemolysin-type calcium-binding region protein [Candidatus Thiomargarita nelsonii]